MAFTKSPFYKSSTFWTSAATALTGLATTATTMFDKGFIDQHPVIGTAMALGGLLMTTIAAACYAIARAMSDQAVAASSSTESIFVAPVEGQ